MKTVPLGDTGIVISRLAYGCWRLSEISAAEGGAGGRLAGAQAAVLAAVEAGYTLFDHADIYGLGECETLFGKILKGNPGLRDRMVLASKCGIRRADDPPGAPYRYDFSREYIVRSCEASLKRLGVETLDLYQLHRPDFLMDPTEVAAAFADLRTAGKVREFGVSNFAPSQVVALQRACPRRLVVNQVEISLMHQQPLTDGTLDQCLSERMVPMAWSPLAAGMLGDGARRLLPSQEGYRTEDVNQVLDSVAGAHAAGRTGVALAWLLRHPAGVVPIVGSTHPKRIVSAAEADGIQLSREEWYRLLSAARGQALP